MGPQIEQRKNRPWRVTIIFVSPLIFNYCLLTAGYFYLTIYIELVYFIKCEVMLIQSQVIV